MRFPGDVLLGYMTLEPLRANADLTRPRRDRARLQRDVGPGRRGLNRIGFPQARSKTVPLQFPHVDGFR